MIKQLLTIYHEKEVNLSEIEEPLNLRNFLEKAYKYNVENNKEIKETLNCFVGFPSSNKLIRNNLHSLIKKYPKSLLDSQTYVQNNESFIKLFIKTSTKNLNVIKRKNNNKANEWNLRPSSVTPENSKNYLKFKLLKENIDTMTAINLLSKILHINSNNFFYAGTKDKRGITCQNITIYQKKPSIFKKINAYNSNNSCLRVGNFELVNDNTKLGELNGNLFEITLRNVHLMEIAQRNSSDSNSTATISENYGEDLTIFKNIGEEFNILSKVNSDNFDEIYKEFEEKVYSITSKSLEISSALTTKFNEIKLTTDNKSILENNLLKLKEKLLSIGYLNYFGLQRFGRGGTPSHLIGLAILRSDYKLCIDYLFRPKKNEHQELTLIKKYYFQNDYLSALKCLNKYSKSNSLLNESKILSKLKSAPRDYCGAYNSIHKFSRLICLHALQSYTFNKILSYRIKLYGYQLIVGDLVIKNKEILNNKNEDNNNSESKKDEEDEQASKKIKLDDSSSGVTSYEAEDINQYIHTITEEDIKNNSFSIHDVVLPLVGYNSIFPKDSAIQSYVDNLLSCMGITLNSFKTCLPVYQLRGSYRLILERPKQFDYKIINYSNPDAEINTTEISKFKTENKKNNRDEAKIEVTEEKMEEVEVNLEESKPEEEKKAEYTGIIFKFALSPGSYATMLLRECTKQSTETDYQAMLTNKHKDN